MSVPDGVKPHSVSAVTNAVKARLEEHFAVVWVVGEVSTFKKHTSGHWYFSLKDPSSVLKCVMYRGTNMRLRFDPTDGMQVIVRGSVTVYAPKGEYQFTVEELHPKGIGAGELALRQLKEKLSVRGYFRPERKRPLPRFPRCVALVASSTGAALRDMLELLKQRWPLTRVVVRGSKVQGDDAAAQIAANIRFLSDLSADRRLPLDAIILGRGGGSAQDLSAFNEEVVADAIFESSVPVVSAVGHEIDVTIADLVADRRAETPSAAIVALVPHQREIAATLNNALGRLREAATSRVHYARHGVSQLANRPAFRKPLARVRELERRLLEVGQRLVRAAKVRVERDRRQLAAAAEQLDALSPLNVLKRGYALTLRGDGTVVRATTDVAADEVIRTRLTDGEILSRVISTTAAAGTLEGG